MFCWYNELDSTKLQGAQVTIVNIQLHYFTSIRFGTIFRDMKFTDFTSLHTLIHIIYESNCVKNHKLYKKSESQHNLSNLEITCLYTSHSTIVDGQSSCSLQPRRPF